MFVFAILTAKEGRVKLNNYTSIPQVRLLYLDQDQNCISLDLPRLHRLTQRKLIGDKKRVVFFVVFIHQPAGEWDLNS
ncbi:hypothetical protein AAHA92_18340 [Salvia divinorum]|uniref:Uncharacterized protein n=1 Tax=Salvia divinorum TaxID=28513 RepID=A0ABD1H322_SALDI